MWWLLGLLASLLVIVFVGICYVIGEAAYRRSLWVLFWAKPGPATLIRNGFDQLRRESGDLDANMMWRLVVLLELYVDQEIRRQRRETGKKKKDSNQKRKDV